MRFMMFMIPQGYANAAPDKRPNAKMVERMMKYNEELTKAGALISLDGLYPPSASVRVRYGGGKATVTDGPFPEAKEIVGGYWMIRAKSKEEAIEWARRVPANDGDVVEVRQVFEMSDFPPDVQKAADSKLVQEKVGKNMR